MEHDIAALVAKRAEDAKRFLMELIEFESTPGREGPAIEHCRQWYAGVCPDCTVEVIEETIKLDPEYSHADPPLNYDGRGSLAALRKGTGGGHSVILQSHADVVPAADWPDAFTPREDGGYVIGRGACDAKGQVAAIWLAMAALDEMGAELAGDVQAQIVVEEEPGGNGALDLIRKGYRADAAVVMESTNLNIHPANRGAIWFRIEVEGLPAHMGRKHEGVSAIDLACRVIEALYEYEKRIVADSRGYPGFERYESPVQVNIGLLRAGEWPSMVAGNAVIEGGVGFLPNRSMEQVKTEIREAIDSIPDQWLKSHYTLTFPRLHNDSYETDYSHPAVLALASACRSSGVNSGVFGWNVSCDARLYARLGGMPTVVFGPGDFAQAHSRGERIDFGEVAKAAEILVRFVCDWCGGETL